MTHTLERWTWEEGVWMGTPPKLISIGEMVALTTEKPKDPPPAIAQRLSEHWGATSLHGMVFRRPKGLIWWHCEACRSPSSPSGMRSYVLSAHGPAQMEVVCALSQEKPLP